MTITAQESIDRLIDVSTKEQLRELISQISIEATGKITILYSGTTADGISNAEIIQGMLLNGDDIRVIDKTEAAKFLQLDNKSPGYNQALAEKIAELGMGGDPIYEAPRVSRRLQHWRMEP